MGISDAKNIEELEKQFMYLFVYLDSLPPRRRLWSDLRDIINAVEKRVEMIGDLSDIAQGNTIERIGNLFGGLAQRVGIYRTAINILAELWNRLGEFQSKFDDGKRHIYRAAVGYYLGQICFDHGNIGEAIWLLLHVPADDLLGTPPHPHGGAYDFLRLALGVSDDVFQYLEYCLKIRGNERHELFAEHLVTQLSLKPSCANLFSYPSMQLGFPIGRAYARNMLDRVNRRVSTNEQDSEEHYVGRYLEELVRYLIKSGSNSPQLAARL